MRIILQQIEMPPQTGPSGSWRIRWLNSLPSSTMKSSPGRKMPHFVAIDRAVLTLSPVTIRTVMPALWHFFMASGTLKQNMVRRITHTDIQSIFS